MVLWVFERRKNIFDRDPVAVAHIRVNESGHFHALLHRAEQFAFTLQQRVGLRFQEGWINTPCDGVRQIIDGTFRPLQLQTILVECRVALNPQAFCIPTEPRGPGNPAWVKNGPSPNPKGRPAGVPDKRLLATQAALDGMRNIVAMLVGRALEGDTNAASIVLSKVLPSGTPPV